MAEEAGVLRRLWVSVVKGQPAALELLVGRDGYGDTLRRIAPRWMLAVLGGSLIGVLVAFTPAPGFHRASVAIVIGGSIGGLVLPLWLWTAFRQPSVELWTALTAVAGAVLFSLVVAFAGPLSEEAVVYLPASAAGLFLFGNRRTANVGVGLALVGYAAVVLSQSGYPNPVSRILIASSFTIPTALLMGWIVRHVERLSAQEREGARNVAELAARLSEMNQLLEERVSTQVAEIETLGQLRRFLSPQVADVVLNSGDRDLLRPHRSKVAVLFCDLRGFTAFTSNAEPEELVEALDEYFAIAGHVLQRHNATIGMFAGDGIMAYLNDPVPCNDPAGTAVAMALELRQTLSAFATRWSDRGHDLGYGIGLAYGYATLAIIGFEGRSDYTPLGSVVNLASRLCAEAPTGEVLIDARTRNEIGSSFQTQAQPVSLKGLPGIVTAFHLTGAPTLAD